MEIRQVIKIVEEIMIKIVVIKKNLNTNLLIMVQLWEGKNKYHNIKVLIMELLWVEK